MTLLFQIPINHDIHRQVITGDLFCQVFLRKNTDAHQPGRNGFIFTGNQEVPDQKEKKE